MIFLMFFDSALNDTSMKVCFGGCFHFGEVV